MRILYFFRLVRCFGRYVSLGVNVAMNIATARNAIDQFYASDFDKAMALSRI